MEYSAMDYEYVIDRLDSIYSELVTLSQEANYGARGRLAVRHITSAMTEIKVARTHVAGQRKAATSQEVVYGQIAL